MLVDDGKLRLDDPLSKYIPAFANVTVGAARQPLARPIMIEDLLRHTSGFTYGFYGETAVRKLYASSGLVDGDLDNAKFVDRLAKLPLQEQPGTLWDYGHSIDVLGRVIEVISGQPLYQFEKARLLDPLGMHETRFVLGDPSTQARVAEPLPQDRFGEPVAGVGDMIPTKAWEAGGAGLISTMGDYARFAQMLLNGGALDGHRYLKQDTVALMTRDHLNPEIARDEFYFPGADSGFGLGFAVRTKAMPPFRNGEYRWDGVGGTSFFVDPKDDLFVIVMMRSPSQRNRIETDLRVIVYDALRP
jgi:CubicO group peptidase (beta-lactamase class C family)